MWTAVEPVTGDGEATGSVDTAKELATDLVVIFAKHVRRARSGRNNWSMGIACAVESAVCLAYGFDTDQARAFIETLMERIE